MECSSRGEKRLSAFYARLALYDGKSIEELYQAKKKFADGKTNLSIKDAKGKVAVNQRECAKFYSDLWDIYIASHPELYDIIKAARGLSDVFGQEGHCCQATELWRIRNAPASEFPWREKLNMADAITYQKWIRRADLKKNPLTIYVFGDNTLRQGLGGQAKEMRGEPNAFGIATKRRPGKEIGDYFSDDSAEDAKWMVRDVGALLHLIMEKGSSVILPQDGLGTGLSELPERAPRLYRILYDVFAAISECPWRRPI